MPSPNGVLVVTGGSRGIGAATCLLAAEGGYAVVVRPMMYLALSYDHRVVDGKEAVTFLVRVKESLEAPERLVLDL
jgi:pyruvate/2-oxoglutarate dehydrogenase complex dihydrolipoamide acyltransferase (E2) component